tara:strand:+ start:48605 stop:48988 length:384 start_codon:yes stop_codon:yes gene_type:complete
MKKLIALKDGKEIEVLVERVGTKTWFHYEGKTTSIESSHGSSRRSGKDSASTHPGQILAPMPGKILKLNSSNESQVKAGDIILIMEAMKMEYSLAADVDGTVTGLNVSVGDQVNKDQLLAQIQGDEV